MTKKEICKVNKTFAYWSGLGGVEFKKIEYGIEDYIYCVSNAWYGGEKGKRYHKLKVYTDFNGNCFMKLNGYKIDFRDCLRTDIF